MKIMRTKSLLLELTVSRKVIRLTLPCLVVAGQS